VLGLLSFVVPVPYLHSKFGHRKLDAILNFFHKWGTTALAVSTAVPILMPTSMLFAGAGSSDYGVGRFLTVVIICRSARYTFIAIVADHCGGHFVRVLRHPSQYWGWLRLFAAVIFSLIVAGILLNRRLTAATTA
jgi:membrane protein DedA with SNARE-associated domain